ncbi:MAG: metallophosphoesterase family protein [Armatimonadota bacterium]
MSKTQLLSTFLFVLSLWLCGNSWGRNTDGKLGIIYHPISTNPAIVVPGGVMEVKLISEAPLSDIRLELFRKDETIELFESRHGVEFKPSGRLTFGLPTKTLPEVDWQMNWSHRPREYRRDMVRIQLTLPATIPEGFYGLRVYTNVGSDTSLRAVRVLKEWTKSYQFCHITDVHIGSTRVPGTQTAFQKVIQHINSINPMFVLVTGDNVDTPAPESFAKFLSILDELDIPSFVVPGNHDSYGFLRHGKVDVLSYFGAPYYSFRFGRHYYLAVDGATQKFDEAQRLFMADDMQRNERASFKCVFSHAMAYQDDRALSWMTAMLKNASANLYVTGHRHVNVIELTGDRQTVSVCSAPVYTRQECFSVITVENDEVKSIRRIVD